MITIINFLDPTFNFWALLLPFGRIYGIFIVFPLFAGNNLLSLLRFSLALLLTFLIYPHIPKILAPENFSLGMLLLVKEVFYGATLGWLMSLPIYLIEASGNIIDVIRGEQISSLISPITKNHSSSLAKLINQGFITYFVINGGLLWVLDNLIKSFGFIAINQLYPQKMLSINYIMDLFINFCYWVLMLALPTIILMFLIELSLGVISSFIPQLNVTVISMPIKSAAAMVILVFSLPNMYHLAISKFLHQVTF